MDLRKWGNIDDVKCQQCKEDETFEHVLCSCKVALSEGRFPWRYNKVLEVILQSVKMAVGLESAEQKEDRHVTFVSAGGTRKVSPITRVCSGARGREWEVLVDIKSRLVFPQDIVITNMRPDMILRNDKQHKLWIVELTVPYETNIMESHHRKSLKYEELRQACELKGWRAECFAIEVGCRGFAGLSLRRFYKELGLSGKQLTREVEKATASAEKASAWLWLKRNEKWVRGNQG